MNRRCMILLAMAMTILAVTASANAQTVSRISPSTPTYSASQRHSIQFRADFSGLTWPANWDYARWYVDGIFHDEDTMGGQSDTSTTYCTFWSPGTYTVKVYGKWNILGIPGTTGYVTWTVNVSSSVPDASRVSPASPVKVYEGDTQEFTVQGTDPGGDLRGVEWYLDSASQGSFNVLSGSSDTHTWSHTFDTSGTYEVKAKVYDVHPLYSDFVYWTVNVTHLHALTLSSTAGGSVTDPGEGSFDYDDGTNVTLKATPDDGYHFTGWSGSVAATSNPLYLTVDNDYDVTANFAPNAATYTLTISSGAGGSVTSPGEGAFEHAGGTDVTLEATPDDGYHFTHWSGSLSSTNNPLYLTVDNDYDVTANFALSARAIYVDDDGPGDPGPGNPAVSDPQEDGTAEHPFDMIQKGIDAALDGETVIVRDGTYWEAIDFKGRNITVTGFEPNDPNAILPYPVIDANYSGTAVTFCHEEEPNCILEGFVITRGAGDIAGGINCMGSSPTISHCLILGNRVMDPKGGGGAVFCIDSNAVFENCTFSGNYGGEQGAGLCLCDSNAVLLNCILWDNLPYQSAVDCGLDPNITFSDVQDTWPGQCNMDIAPFFVELGYWADANNPNIAVEPSEPNAVWVGGDYHLKSQAGRWDPYSSSWIIDDVTSLCIDAGDPNSDWTAELWPHGKCINMGAYGGTTQASMSLLTVADPLSEALDTPLSFTTGGNADWFSQTAISYNDGDAAQSGDISDNQESLMQTTVSGKGMVKFYWKVSSEADCDYLEFYIDGELQDQISGTVDWQQMTYTISTLGSHTLEWRYTKDYSRSRGSDCGWVDKVE